MLYHILYELLYERWSVWSPLRIFKYITFRSVYAALTSLIVGVVLLHFLIKVLKKYKINQIVKSEYLPNHEYKNTTPTMGGLGVICATVFSSLLWVRWDIYYLWLALLVLVSLGIVGFIDDYLKFKNKTPYGLRPKTKLLSQIFIGCIVAYILETLTSSGKFTTQLLIPFSKNLYIDPGILYPLLVILILTASSNAVNLTDGLDGLAIGCVIMSAIMLGGMCYVAGNYNFSHYLKVIFVSGAGEFTVVMGALVGASLGFLWYNAYPAQIFMGDVGSLALGALLGLAAIVCKQELLFILIGGLFVIEALSVILQVIYYKLCKRRLFAITPLHHHFEYKGWKEPKIVVRLWIIAGVILLFFLSSLKLR